eukprot:RCo044434
MGNVFRSFRRKANRQSHLEQRSRTPPRSGDDVSVSVARDTTPGPASNSPGTAGPRAYPALHTAAVNSVKLLIDRPDEILSGGEDRSIRVTKLSTAKSSLELPKAHDKDVNRLLYCERRNAAVSASRDKTVKLWSLAAECTPEQRLRHTFAGHDFNVSTIAVNGDQDRLFSGSRDNTLRLWDIESGQSLSVNRTARNIVQSSTWLRETSVVVQGGEDLYLRFWDTQGGHLSLIQAIPDLVYHPVCMDSSADGLAILTGHNGFVGEGSMAKLWDSRQRSVVREFLGHQYTITNCAFLNSNRRDGRELLATTSNDNTLRIWDRNTGDCVQTNVMPEIRMTSLAVVAKTSEHLTRSNGQLEVDLVVGFLSGLVAAYALDENCQLLPVAYFGSTAAMPQDSTPEN